MTYVFSGGGGGDVSTGIPGVVISALANGIVFDGTTDNTTKLQALLNAAANFGGATGGAVQMAVGTAVSGPLTLPPGVVFQGVNGQAYYNATSTLPNSTNVSRLLLKSGSAGPLLSPNDGGTNLATAVRITDLMLDCNGQTHPAINLPDSGTSISRFWNIERCYVTNIGGSSGYAVYIGNQNTACTMRDCVVFNGQSGSKAGYNGIGWYGSDGLIDHCFVGYFGNAGLTTLGGTADETLVVQGNSGFFTCLTGIAVGGSGFTMIGGSVDHNYNDGIFIGTAGTTTLSGVTFHSNSQQTNNTWSNVTVGANNAKLTVMGCRAQAIDAGITNNPAYMFHVGSSEGVEFQEFGSVNEGVSFATGWTDYPDEEAVLGSVDFWGADPTGNEDSLPAFNAAYAALGGDTGFGNIMLGAGTYKLSAAFTSKSLGIGMIGPGSASCTITSHSAGDTLRFYEQTWNTGFGLDQPFVAGTLRGFTVDGTNASAGASGLHYGDLMNGQFQDINIQHFNGANSIGLWMDNIIGWCERMTWLGVEVFDCTTGIMFDQNGGASTGPGFGSFAYAHYRDVKLAMLANQDGICIRNGCLLTGSIMDVSGNFWQSSTGSNSGAMLRIIGSSTGAGGTSYSQLDSCVFNFGAETDYISGSGTPHQTIFLDTNFQNRFNCTGIMWFNGNWAASNFVPGAAGAQGTFLYAGHIFGDTNLADQSFPAFSVIGGTSWSPGQWINSTGSITLFISTGDGFDLGTLSGNTTIILSDVPTQGKRIRIRAKQPASGGPYTITWPANTIVKWVGGAPTASTGASDLDEFELSATVGLPWVGQAFLNVH